MQALYDILDDISKKLPEALLADRMAVHRELGKLRRLAKQHHNLDQLLARSARLDARIQRSVNLRRKRMANQPKLLFDADLPINGKKEELIDAIGAHQVLIVAGETGSGKTTQLPKFCLAAGRGIEGMIGVTQPRRIATLTVGRRIAQELQEDVGQTLGIKIRFQDHTSEHTRIKLMTDGILLAEAQSDRFLNQYDTIIVDEAHERSLNIDFILGMLKQLLTKRPDLKIIITSATIDTQKFAQAFGDAPIIEVSGRMYPVETLYMPPDTDNGEENSHIEQAVAALDQIHQQRPKGDVLIFMPTEQDIRDTCEVIQGRRYANAETIPLFARLSASEQQRVFQTSKGHKIIVATNVAETSITIPGIRYVVDTGLARILQYTPRSRTNTLPVVPISRSSADQRLGRCGRVANGVCIRLFSQADYEQRPQYTKPEILRANLAEVILRMIALGLGDVETFDFIDPPAPRSIQDGYNLLLELGAIIPKQRSGKKPGRYTLTHKGRLMAKLPLDPRLACMLLEAHQRNCLKDVAIIAAALSIQDPRERPTEKQAQADAAQAKFTDPASDFITLLRLWHSYNKIVSKRSSWQQVKQFCRDHFLSFRRMREWRDVLHQITSVLDEHDIRATSPARPPDEPGDIGHSWYAAIHQSILGGFLSNIAFKKEKQIFQASHNRQVMIFPGSGVFKNPGQWIVAAEMVETSRLFARCVAVIDPNWLEPIGKTQCKYTYLDPHWEKKREAVMATEQVTLYGLTIDRRLRPYGPINPDEATEIFIRNALIQGDVRQPLPFMKHNLHQMAQVEEMQDRLRRRDLLVDEHLLFEFYQARIGQTYDMIKLKQFLKKKGSDHFLRLQQTDLLTQAPEHAELAQYPDYIEAEGMQFKCNYCFEPGNAEDGVTVRIPAQAAGVVPKQTFQWMVPGLLKEKIGALIKALPKELRKQLVPVNDTVQIITTQMPIQREANLITALSQFISKQWGVEIPAAVWDEEQLPEHLRMRIAVTNAKGHVVRAGRTPAVLQSDQNVSDAKVFAQAKKDWERGPLTTWDFGDLPQSIPLKASSGHSWTAYPALEARDTSTFLTAYADAAEARRQHPQGVKALFRQRLTSEIKYLRKNIALPYPYEARCRYFGGRGSVEAQLIDSVLDNHLALQIHTQKEFESALEHFYKKGISGWGRDRQQHLITVLDTYHELRTTLADLERTHMGRSAILSFIEDLRSQLQRLVPDNFIALYHTETLLQLPRYLQAMAIRAQRGVVDLEKDRSKAALVTPYEKRLEELIQGLSSHTGAEKRQAIEAYFWMVEEYKISIFAQQIKTRHPVSPKRLDRYLKEIDRMV